MDLSSLAGTTLLIVIVLLFLALYAFWTLFKSVTLLRGVWTHVWHPEYNRDGDANAAGCIGLPIWLLCIVARIGLFKEGEIDTYPFAQIALFGGVSYVIIRALEWHPHDREVIVSWIWRVMFFIGVSTSIIWPIGSLLGIDSEYLNWVAIAKALYQMDWDSLA